MRHALSRFEREHADVESTYACLYRDALLVFVSYGVRVGGRNSAAELSDLIARFGSLRCGLGEEVALSEGDLTVRQALMLLDMARERDVASLEWFDGGSLAFRRAAAGDRLFSRTSEMYLRHLRDYDAANDSGLVETAREFVRAFGGVKDAAESLFQHPNTVRYRLRKIKALMGMPDASDRELMVFLAFVFLSQKA